MKTYALKTLVSGREETLTNEATEDNVINAISSLDWSTDINAVWLESDDNEILEVSGSEAEGFSSSYIKNAYITVISTPPTSTRQMEDILVYFLRDNPKWHKNYDFSSHVKIRNSKIDKSTEGSLYINPGFKKPIRYLLGPFFMFFIMIFIAIALTGIDYAISGDVNGGFTYFGMALFAAAIIATPLLFIIRLVKLFKYLVARTKENETKVKR